ncbi:MAG TPA: hypothetical protein VF810_05115 [Patescibacteria group bacterium]
MGLARTSHEKINSAYALLQGTTLSVDTFMQIVTLLKGIHPKLDQKLTLSEELLSKLQKIQNVDVISLTTDTLPEETEKDKKRKKALIFFINSLNSLKSEIKRVQTEFDKTDKPTHNFDKIVYQAKGPFGLITLIAVLIVGISLIMGPKNQAVNKPIPITPSQSATAKIKVIIFQGKSIPVSEFFIGQGPDCGGGGVPHYHAPNETTVKTLDGTNLQDPGGCGFGKVQDTQIVELTVTTTPSK